MKNCMKSYTTEEINELEKVSQEQTAQGAKLQRKKYMEEYWKSKSTERKQYMQEYCQKNKLKKALYNQKYYQDNREGIMKKYHQENPKEQKDGKLEQRFKDQKLPSEAKKGSPKCKQFKQTKIQLQGIGITKDKAETLR